MYRFSGTLGKCLLDIAYADPKHGALENDQATQLIQMSRHWIRRHV